MNAKDKLIQMIEENETVKRYKKIESLINSHKELKDKFAALKQIQKQLVNAKHIGKKEAIETFQARYDQLMEDIETYPLMSEYLALQSDINTMIQEIVSIIETGIEEDFER